MALTHTLGYPRIGAQRELPMALAACAHQETDEAHLQGVVRELRLQRWRTQQAAGLSCLTAGDLALHDPMLSQTILWGAWPARFGFDAAELTADQQIALAQGTPQQPAMAMRQWFDTHAQYLVPEVGPHTRFDGGSARLLFEEIAQAQALGLNPKPVLIGPLTWLYLARSEVDGFDRLSLMPALVRALARTLQGLGERGVSWVQLDEPALGLDLPAAWLEAGEQAYAQLAQALNGRGPQLLLATYFEGVGEHASRLARWPVQGYHLDLVKAPDQLSAWSAALPADKVLSVGVIDGRNIWRTDLVKVLATLRPLHARLKERLWIAPSCSLAHVPVSLAPETRLDAELKSWLAFAQEKLDELQVLARALTVGDQDPTVAQALAASAASIASRRRSGRAHNPMVQRQWQAITPEMGERRSPLAQRIVAQREALPLPPWPTKANGVFAQTARIQQARSAYKRREINALQCLARLREEIRQVVDQQTALGLDVLVHGEPQRHDLVEHVAEQLWGHALTESGWVQRHGAQCIKPPILHGDIYRPEPITVETTRYAQSLTDKPMTSVLPGPVTLLQWSFVRDDQPREVTALQLALAIRAEVADLEKAGIGIIQIDEPAFHEGLPLKRRDWSRHLDGAVRAFKVAACGVADSTRIHAHLGHPGVEALRPSLATLDVDAFTTEAA